MQKSEFASRALDILQSEAAPGQLITAAKIGLLLRREFDGPAWKDAGYASLKKFLVEMEQDGLLQVGESEHGALAAAVTSEVPATKLGTATKNEGASAGKFEKAASLDEQTAIHRPLRSMFWQAFAISSPPGRRFLNKATGEVRMGQKGVPESEVEWVEIEPISTDTQREWAREFLASKNLNSAEPFGDAVASDDWYRAVPSALRSHSPELASEWNRMRSANIARVAYRWAKNNNINPNSIFIATDAKQRLIKTQLPIADLSNLKEDQIKKFVLQAMSQAPIDWLLEIPIPTKYLLRALSKSKVPF